MKRIHPLVMVNALAAIVTIMFLTYSSSLSARPVPTSNAGWFPAGSHPAEYKMEITSERKHSGSHSAMIEYTSAKDPSGFGTFMQMHKRELGLEKD